MRTELISPPVEAASPLKAQPQSGILAFLGLAFLAFALLIYFSAVPGGNASMIAFIMLQLIGVVLAFGNSRYLLPYVLCIWMFAPLTRRLIEYMQGTIEPFSLLSVAPLAVTLTLLIPCFWRRLNFSSPLRKALTCFLLALIYGGIVGLQRNGPAAIYDVANYLIPLLLVVYLALRPMLVEERDSLLTMFLGLVVLMAAYGWIQFLFAPDWDTFWMRNSQMISLGLPEPRKFRIFSTTSAPGIAGLLFATALVPMLMEKRWRGRFGWIGVALVASALALTLVRSAWLLLGLGLFAYILSASGPKRWAAALRVAAVVGLAFVLLPLLPGAQAILSRAQTLTNLEEDRSFNVRSEFSGSALIQVLSEPVGRGAGSVGLASKLAKVGGTSEFNFSDNGYLALLTTFGYLGGLAFFAGLGFFWKAVRRSAQQHPRLKDHASLAISMLVFILGSLIFSNSIPGMGGLLLWLFIGLALAKPPAQGRSAA